MGKPLNSSGRLVLTQHVSSSFPLHVRVALDPPKQVLQQLEAKFARFLWGLLLLSPEVIGVVGINLQCLYLRMVRRSASWKMWQFLLFVRSGGSLSITLEYGHHCFLIPSEYIWHSNASGRLAKYEA